MFRTRTTFIIGAGASCELGFPSGTKLLSEIASDLAFYIDAGHVEHGSPYLWERLQDHAQRAGDDLRRLWQVSNRISAAAKIGRSIDNVIHQNDDDPLIPFVAKVAIAHQILHAERKSRLAIAPENPLALDFDAFQDTWLPHFAQMLTTDVPKSQVESILENIAIITFNYDRSVERFLPYVLNQAYDLPLQEAQRIVRESLRIHHPYGQVGSLDWLPRTSVTVDYGQGVNPIPVSENILTFTEQVGSVEAQAIRLEIEQSERLVFLGFGYHNQNMQLLSAVDHPRVGIVYGTMYQEPPPAQDAIRDSVRAMLTTAQGTTFHSFLVDQDCKTFLRHFYRQLTA